MSAGAEASTTATPRSVGVSSESRARASASSPGSVRSPARGPLGITAGFAPRNDGVVPTTRSSATVTWMATWWPPIRHDHGADDPGSPNTANQYSSGSRRSAPRPPPDRSSSPRTVSSAMIAAISPAVRELIAEATIALAAARWSGRMSRIARPSRGPGV